MYRPLPTCLTIKPSEIDGLGLFATEDISENYILGVTHIADNRFDDGYIRTPLGGFFNHSETPNCEIVDNEDRLILVTLQKINAGEELTARYTLYDPTK